MPADGTLEWTKLIGGNNADYINAMTTGLDGSIYVGGETNSSTIPGVNGQTNAGDYDGFIAKYSPDGTLQWTKLIGGNNSEYITAMTTGLDGSIYMGGVTNSSTIPGVNGQTNAGDYDGFIAKYSPDGTLQWTKLIGGTDDDYIRAMTTGSDGSIYVGGRTNSSTITGVNGQTNAGDYDGFIAKYSPDGTLQWTKLIGGTDDDYIRAMTTGSDGSIYVGGRTNSSTITGVNGQTNAGDYDGFIAKYSPDGTLQWTKLIGGTDDDYIRAMTTGSDGSIYVGGRTNSSTITGVNGQTNAGSADAFLAKYSPDGTLQWTKLIGGTDDDYIRAMTTGSDGSIYVGGRTNSSTITGVNGQTNAGSADAFLAKYSPDGTLQWTKLIGGNNADTINAMTTGSDGSIYGGGYTYSSTITGVNGQTNAGSPDAFLAKYQVAMYQESQISNLSFSYPRLMEFSTKKSNLFKPREYNKTPEDSIHYHATKKMPDGIVLNPRSGKISGQPTSQFSDITMSVWANNYRKKITLSCSE